VTPAEYSGGKDNSMESRDKNSWRICNCFSLPKRTIKIVINVTLVACILAYIIAAVVFYSAQGKIMYYDNTDL
jgi:hypothetical protein